MTTIKRLLKHPLAVWRNINPSARLFLISNGMFGLFWSGWALFFNFYILGLGFDRKFLGLVQGAPALGMLLFCLPMGWVSDRIGRRRALLIGVTVLILGFGLVGLADNANLILFGAFVGGAGDALFVVSVSPLLASLTEPKNRSLVFSLNMASMTFASMFGNYFAGLLPEGLETAFRLAAGSGASYRAIVLLSTGLAFLSLIPLLGIRMPKANDEKAEHHVVDSHKLQDILQNKEVWKLVVPNMVMGFGAALLIPYFNLYLVDRFAVSDPGLGFIFGFLSLVIALGALVGPRLERALKSRVRAVVASQGSSMLFMVVLGLAPSLPVAALALWLRGALINIGAPLWDAFVMDQVPQKAQGTVASLQMLTWQFGWAVGPYISGLVQARAGFGPLFVATSLLYVVAISLTWIWFHRREPRPEAQAALQAEAAVGQ
ncbi:MAG: MFS transporter [Chloroflexi bacterium]|nr:MFS transporter [Chloroflexota bacterium]